MRLFCLLFLFGGAGAAIFSDLPAKGRLRYSNRRSATKELVNPDGEPSGLERLKKSTSDPDVTDADYASKFTNVSEWDQAISSIISAESRTLLSKRQAAVGLSKVGGGNASFGVAWAGAQSNLCMGGRLVPAFYLLGAQKCATSSFAQEFLESPSAVGPHRDDWVPSQAGLFSKELHFFDSHERYAKGLGFWYEHWPMCPADTAHQIAADFTPSYLSSWEAPSRMKDVYGASSNRLTFLVILREPLARMQSSFYHGKSGGWVAKKFATFEQYVQAAMTKFKTDDYRKFHDAAWTPQSAESMDFHQMSGIPFTLSLYYEQLAHWLWFFHPAQFVIAPMKAYVTAQNGLFNGEPDLVRATASMPGVQAYMPPAEYEEPTPHANVHAHPSLERDLHPATISEIREVLDSATGAVKLATLFVPAMKNGMKLYGYHGPPHDVSTVARYVSAYW